MGNFVLLVDDEPELLLSSRMILRSAGISNVLTIDDSREVLPLLHKEDVSAIVLDLTMPYMPGEALLTELKHEFTRIPVIILTATDELETAIECMKAGAFDYLVKPVEKDRFVLSVKRALEFHDLQRELISLKRHLLSERLENEAAFSSIISNDRKMLALFKFIEAISASKLPVLITGETGVGKELAAKAIHELSGLKGSFVAVNVAGLDDFIFSDTIFGHKKGAYTGADTAREGLILTASGGTLFLDEIGDLNISSQVKLLRLLQEETFYPLGSDLPLKSNARIIVSTNQDLKEMVSAGKFRKDLYYRLRGHHINVPPLRERREDIPILLDYFLDEAAKALHKKKPAYPPELITLLSVYHFPGNVRELRAMVFDAVTRHSSGILSMDDFKDLIVQGNLLETDIPSSNRKEAEILSGFSGRFPTLKQAEDFLISEAMRLSKGNQGIAASMLGITRQALNKRLIRGNY